MYVNSGLKLRAKDIWRFYVDFSRISDIYRLNAGQTWSRFS
jgi:hypothetical protein